MSIALSSDEQQVYSCGYGAPNHTILVEKLLTELSHMPKTSITDALNTLAKKNLVIYSQNAAREVSCEFVNMETAKLVYEGLDQTSRIIYDIIRGSGKKGIWKRTLRTSVQVGDNKLTKSIKILENRKLIKTVSEPGFTTRISYKLWEYAMSDEEALGPWYGSKEIDTGYVDVIRKVIRVALEDKATNNKKSEFLRKKSEGRKLAASVPGDSATRLLDPISTTPKYPDLEELVAYVNMVSKAEVRPVHVRSLLKLMINDGEAEEILLDSADPDEAHKVYRMALPSVQMPYSLLDTPCGMCENPPDFENLLRLSPAKYPKLSENQVNGPPAGSIGRISSTATRNQPTAFNSFTQFPERIPPPPRYKHIVEDF